MRIIDAIMSELDGHRLGSGPYHILIGEDELRNILRRHLVPHEHLEGAEPLIVYFETEEDREEFVQAVQEAKPDMRSIKL